MPSNNRAGSPGGYPVRKRRALPPVASPDETPEEVDEQSENASGSRSRRSLPTPMRFFPHQFPVPTTIYGIMTLVAGALLLAVMIFEMREILSPILLAAAVYVIFFPFRKEPKIRPILVVGTVIFLIWFVVSAISVILPFLLAFIFSYIAEPLVTFLSKKWYMRRWMSALGLTLLFVTMIAVSIGYMAPVLVTQVGSAMSSLGKLTDSAVEWAHSGGLHEVTGIPQEKIDTLVEKNLAPRLKQVDGAVMGMAESIGKGAPGYLSTVLNFLMIPFVMFYFIKDYWTVRGALYSFMPQEYQRRSQRFLRDLDEVVGGYLRGDVITSAFQGTFLGVGLYFIGVPGALLLGVLSGFLCLIPFVGAYIALALCAIGALNTANPGETILWVTGLFILQGIIESTVIGPQVMGRHTDLHPIMVIISLLLFGYFMGIPGMLIAIPMTSILIRFATRWRDEKRVEIEEEKVQADLALNPHHASKSDGQMAVVTAPETAAAPAPV